MNDLTFAFCFCGSFITVVGCLIIYNVLDSIAERAGQYYAAWPIVVTIVIGVLSMVLWCICAEPLFNPICINGHENDMTAEYCVVCGADLEPSCDCGYVWAGEEFCPKCGGAYGK